MKLYKTGVYILILAAFSHLALAAPFAFEARSIGMGGVGVATADIATAAFANPAMLAYQRRNDDFSLLVGVGGFLNDPEGVIDDIDNYQSAIDRNDEAEATNIINQLQAKVIAGEISAVVAAGFSGDTYAMAVSARMDVLAVGTLTNVSTLPADLIDPSFNILDVQGIQTTALGLSIARNFDVMGYKVAVGLTPKIVSVEAIAISQPILTTDTGLSELLNEDEARDLGEYTTFDLGLVIGLSEHIQLGLVGENIITEEVSFTTTTGAPVKLTFDSRWRAGVAYRNSFLTLGVDLDVTENNPIVAGGTFSALKTQRLSIGAEFNAFDFAQLRIGVIKNIASDIPDEAGNPFYTAGVGFWLGFNLDIAVVSGEGNSLGAFVQTGFRF